MQILKHDATKEKKVARALTEDVLENIAKKKKAKKMM
jgi:hypothetical protein